MHIHIATVLSTHFICRVIMIGLSMEVMRLLLLLLVVVVLEHIY